MNERWRFFRDGQGRWRWKHRGVDGRIAQQSPCTFKNVEEAHANAKRHGWVESTDSAQAGENPNPPCDGGPTDG